MSTQTLQVGDKAIQSREAFSLLSRYQLMPQFVRNVIIDRAIADMSCTEEERIAAIDQLEQKQQIASPEARTTWLLHHGITPEQMADMAIRPVLLEKFKTATWGHMVDTYFLTRKASLDQVVYSLLRTRDRGIAEELYFRIEEGEQSFAELARQYSQGPEAQTSGLLGPVPLTHTHPAIGNLLFVSQPGQLWQPRALGEWFVIIRLEKLLPAQLDKSMRRRLLNEMFENWLSEQMQQVYPCLLTEDANSGCSESIVDRAIAPNQL